MKKLQHTCVITDDLANLRLDQALVKMLPDYSRSQIQEWMKNGDVKINDKLVKTRAVVKLGDTIEVDATLRVQASWEAEAIPLEIVYEDEEIIVINKPAGMVVHPGAGHQEHTLLNALLYHAPQLQELPRAGILHRLDKDTSGLLIIAKTENSLKNLTNQLKKRTMVREYQTIVTGVLVSGGTVDEPIGRHATQRMRMAVTDAGRTAITHYRVMERYRAHTRLKIRLETGRTHQIRVHMAYINHNVVGDPTYGGQLYIPKGVTPALRDELRQFKRQALHAFALGIIHPVTKEPMRWEVELPDDIQVLIKAFKQDLKEANA